MRPDISLHRQVRHQRHRNRAVRADVIADANARADRCAERYRIGSFETAVEPDPPIVAPAAIDILAARAVETAVVAAIGIPIITLAMAGVDQQPAARRQTKAARTETVTGAQFATPMAIGARTVCLQRDLRRSGCRVQGYGPDHEDKALFHGALPISLNKLVI